MIKKITQQIGGFKNILVATLILSAITLAVYEIVVPTAKTYQSNDFFQSKEGRTIVELGNEFSAPVLSNSGKNKASSGPISVNIPAGHYDISLVSFDDHSNSEEGSQLEESWYLALRDSAGEIIAVTSPISDLADDQDYLTETVSRYIYLPKNIASISIMHAAYPNNYSENSIRALCVAFDKKTDFPSANFRPAIQTEPASSVTFNSAVLFGYINPNGEAGTERWFELGQDEEDFDLETEKEIQGIAAENYNFEITDLKPDTEYYFRAVAQNGAGIVKGATLNFKTKSIPLVQVSTNPVTNTTQTTVTFNASATNEENLPSFSWFQWGKDKDNLQNKTPKKDIGTASLIDFSENIVELSPNTLYYFRAVTENQYGLHFGSILSFHTRREFQASNKTNDTSQANINNKEKQLLKDLSLKLESTVISNQDCANCEAVLSGDKVKYKITISNTGEAQLKNITVKNKISDHLELIDYSSGAKFNENSKEISWFVGDLKAKQEKIFEFSTIVEKINEENCFIENKAIASGNGLVKESNTNTLKALICIPSATTNSCSINSPVSIILINDKTKISAGEATIFTLRYKNELNMPVENIRIKIDIPREMKYDAESLVQHCAEASFSEKENILILSVNKMVANEECSAIFSAQSPQNAKDDLMLTTKATLEYDKGDSETNSYAVNIIKNKGLAAMAGIILHGEDLTSYTYNLFAVLSLIVFFVALALLIRQIYIIRKNK